MHAGQILGFDKRAGVNIGQINDVDGSVGPEFGHREGVRGLAYQHPQRRGTFDAAGPEHLLVYEQLIKTPTGPSLPLQVPKFVKIDFFFFK